MAYGGYDYEEAENDQNLALYAKESAYFFDKYKVLGNKTELTNLFKGICENGLEFFKRNETYFKMLTGEQLLLLIDFINEGKHLKTFQNSTVTGHNPLSDTYQHTREGYIGLETKKNDYSYDVISYIQKEWTYKSKIDAVKNRWKKEEEQRVAQIEKDNAIFKERHNFDRTSYDEVNKQLNSYYLALYNWAKKGIKHNEKGKPRLIDFGLDEELLRTMTDYYKEEGIQRAKLQYENALRAYQSRKIKLGRRAPIIDDFDLKKEHIDFGGYIDYGEHSEKYSRK